MKHKFFAIIFTAILFFASQANLVAQEVEEEDVDIQHPEIMQELKLTDTQKDKLFSLRTEFQKKMVDLKAELQKNMISVRELRNSDNINRKEVLALTDKINDSRNKIAIARANHLMDMYEVLTPDQRAQLKKIKGKMHRMGKMKHRKEMMRGKCEKMKDRDRDREFNK